MSALRQFEVIGEDDEAIVEEEETILDEIFNRCYDDLIEACKEGKVSDDNAVIGAVLSLMERVVPKLLDAYKKDKKEYDGRCLACATALRVTIGACMPFDKFMEIMHNPKMIEIDTIVQDIVDNGKTEGKVDELADIFRNLKGIEKKRPDIYG